MNRNSNRKRNCQSEKTHQMETNKRQQVSRQKINWKNKPLKEKKEHPRDNNN